MGRFSALIVIASLSASPLGLVKADEPGPDWISAKQVIKMAKQAGYSRISELEANDGQWEGKGIKNSRKMEFHADAKTGETTSEEPDDD